jgi:hypothetical protein
MVELSQAVNESHRTTCPYNRLSLELKKPNAKKDRTCCTLCAMVNGQCLIHREYTSASGSVSVALYDDRLEIISLGELHFA